MMEKYLIVHPTRSESAGVEALRKGGGVQTLIQNYTLFIL